MRGQWPCETEVLIERMAPGERYGTDLSLEELTRAHNFDVFTGREDDT